MQVLLGLVSDLVGQSCRGQALPDLLVVLCEDKPRAGLPRGVGRRLTSEEFPSGY